MPVYRVTLTRPVYPWELGVGVTEVDFVSADDTLEEAEAWAYRDYGPGNVRAVTEVHEDTGHWVNGQFVAPVAFPYNGPPQPQVALDDNLQPLDRSRGAA